MKKTNSFLVGAILSFVLFGCGKDDSPAPEALDEVLTESPVDPNESTPEELAKQLGLEMASTNRKVPASQFKDYPLVVDIFRSSASRPVAGAFRESYVDQLVPDRSLPPQYRLELARKRFANAAAQEFAITSIHGKIRKFQIVSTAIEAEARGGFRTTPSGNFKLDAIAYQKRVLQPDGTRPLMLVLFPWLKSATYDNSPMYWGLWLFGGYFMHSTPHYGQLGTRASMGCIRQAFPDAIELFRLRQYYRGMVRIHPIGSEQAVRRFQELSTTERLLQEIGREKQKIRDYIAFNRSTEVHSNGHTWIDASTRQPNLIDWPNCGPIDCFTIWGMRVPSSHSRERLVPDHEPPIPFTVAQ